MFYYKEIDGSEYSFHLQVSSKKYPEKFKENGRRTLRRKCQNYKIELERLSSKCQYDNFQNCINILFSNHCRHCKKCEKKITIRKPKKLFLNYVQCLVEKEWWEKLVLIKVDHSWKRKDDPNQLMAIDQEMSRRRS